FLGLGHLLAMAIGGLLLGVVWQLYRLERFWCAVSAGGVYVASVMGPVLHRGFDMLSLIVLFFGLSAIAWIGALAGFGREIERSGGFRREA
ncbi:MAG TPA: hypothetical protein VK348_01600, partial [Planctomycetota bacterium]|nr:hypothetical protein [Planctomycetota bacterium]